MRSVFSSSVSMHQKFDLKGSTVDRQASDKERVLPIAFTGNGLKHFLCRQRVIQL